MRKYLIFALAVGLFYFNTDTIDIIKYIESLPVHIDTMYLIKTIVICTLLLFFGSKE